MNREDVAKSLYDQSGTLPYTSVEQRLERIMQSMHNVFNNALHLDAVMYYFNNYPMLNTALKKYMINQFGKGVEVTSNLLLYMALDADPIKLIESAGIPTHCKSALITLIRTEGDVVAATFDLCTSYLSSHATLDGIRDNSEWLPISVLSVLDSVMRNEEVKILLRSCDVDTAKLLFTSKPQMQRAKEVQLRDDSFIMNSQSVDSMVTSVLTLTGGGYAEAFLHLLRLLAKVNLFGSKDYKEVFNIISDRKGLLEDLEANVAFSAAFDASMIFRYMQGPTVNWSYFDEAVYTTKAFPSDKLLSASVADVVGVISNLSPSSIKNCDNGQELLDLIESHL